MILIQCCYLVSFIKGPLYKMLHFIKTRNDCVWNEWKLNYNYNYILTVFVDFVDFFLTAAVHLTGIQLANQPVSLPPSNLRFDFGKVMSPVLVSLNCKIVCYSNAKLLMLNQHFRYPYKGRYDLSLSSFFLTTTPSTPQPQAPSPLLFIGHIIYSFACLDMISDNLVKQ